jgi:hypothetical protein
MCVPCSSNPSLSSKDSFAPRICHAGTSPSSLSALLSWALPRLRVSSTCHKLGCSYAKQICYMKLSISAIWNCYTKLLFERYATQICYADMLSRYAKQICYMKLSISAIWNCYMKLLYERYAAQMCYMKAYLLYASILCFQQGWPLDWWSKLSSCDMLGVSYVFRPS